MGCASGVHTASQRGATRPTPAYGRRGLPSLYSTRPPPSNAAWAARTAPAMSHVMPVDGCRLGVKVGELARVVGVRVDCARRGVGVRLDAICWRVGVLVRIGTVVGVRRGVVEVGG